MKLALTRAMMKESGATEASRVSPSQSTLSPWLMESGHEPLTGGLSLSPATGRRIFYILNIENFILYPGAEETEAAPAAQRATTQWMSPHPGGQKSEIYWFMLGVKLKKSN